MHSLQARTGDNPLHASDQMPCWSPQESNCELCTHQPLFPAIWTRKDEFITSTRVVKKLTYSRRVKCVTFFKYFSTSQGTCERLLKPPKAVPFQTRPVTNWKGRVDISCPDAATPTITDVPQPCKFLVNQVLYTCRYHLSPQIHTEYSPYGSTLERPSSLRHFQCTRNCSQHHRLWDQQEPAELASHGPLDSRIR